MVYIILADGFEEIEALAPLDILRRANIDVLTVSIKDREVRGSHNIKVNVDILIDEVELDKMDMVILPGGLPGATNLESSEAVKKIIKFAFENEKYIASICAAPMIVGKMGLLEGKEAICYPGYEDDLKGAKISKESVCVSQNFITAKGAGVALEFGFKLAEVLVGKDVSDNLRKAMQYDR